MSIGILATVNEWALYVSVVILCFLSFVLYRRSRRIPSLLILIGLISFISSLLVSNLALNLLLAKTISPQTWETLVIFYNVLSMIGYFVGVLGCILHVFREPDRVTN